METGSPWPSLNLIAVIRPPQPLTLLAMQGSYLTRDEGVGSGCQESARGQTTTEERRSTLVRSWSNNNANLSVICIHILISWSNLTNPSNVPNPSYYSNDLPILLN